MSIKRTTDYCPICGTQLHGRLDKTFCSSVCRSRYFRNKQDERIPVSALIDAILHRNWKILSEFHGAAGKKKFFVDLASLTQKGFHLNYYTTSSLNANQKQYYYVYDFAWMMFSERQVMVIRLRKPK
jgi:hypothetical protein